MSESLGSQGGNLIPDIFAAKRSLENALARKLEKRDFDKRMDEVCSRAMKVTRSGKWRPDGHSLPNSILGTDFVEISNDFSVALRAYRRNGNLTDVHIAAQIPDDLYDEWDVVCKFDEKEGTISIPEIGEPDSTELDSIDVLVRFIEANQTISDQAQAD